MKRIIIHWTAGSSVPNCIEKEHYHFLVDSIGRIHEGKFKPEDNLNCNDGKYAAHTGGGNTNSIGVSLCGMYGFKTSKNIGNFPLTKIQIETAMQLCAKLTKKYNITINQNTVMTHYEFGLKNPKTTSHGKIDIIFLPPYSWIKKEDIGNFLRTKVKWYLEKIRE